MIALPSLTGCEIGLCCCCEGLLVEISFSVLPMFAAMMLSQSSSGATSLSEPKPNWDAALSRLCSFRYIFKSYILKQFTAEVINTATCSWMWCLTSNALPETKRGVDHLNFNYWNKIWVLSRKVSAQRSDIFYHYKTFVFFIFYFKHKKLFLRLGAFQKGAFSHIIPYQCCNITYCYHKKTITKNHKFSHYNLFKALALMRVSLLTVV